MSFLRTHGELVRLLLSKHDRMGRRGRWDYRLICDCQRHAGRRRALDVARVVVGHLQRRAVTRVIAIALAFCALGFPMDAIGALSLPLMAARTQPPPQFHSFTARNSRETVL